MLNIISYFIGSFDKFRQSEKVKGRKANSQWLMMKGSTSSECYAKPKHGSETEKIARSECARKEYTFKIVDVLDIAQQTFLWFV